MQAVPLHQQKNTFARTKFKQYNNIGKDLLCNFCFGFWNKPLVWNNCCQIACICTDSYCKNLRMESYLLQTIQIPTVL